MNWFGLWFTCCMPIMILLGLMWAEYFYMKKKGGKKHDRRARKAYQR